MVPAAFFIGAVFALGDGVASTLDGQERAVPTAKRAQLVAVTQQKDVVPTESALELSALRLGEASVVAEVRVVEGECADELAGPQQATFAELPYDL